ncbi:M-phase inducer phosphatase-like isoform X2 [Venturia canescens]|uniref:M-phase inducer phosphatase-like isoform X2 n=1 Tax=Venturia canescens TaxID=32260 RepID=UPI001C9C4B57|nr:M-phase inducer phosphatase-like isoform X2 [Venturia canescens]
MLWESVTDSCDVLQCTRLFKNAFKIRSTPEGSIKNKKPRARRLLGMASRRLSSPDTTSPSVDKENGSSSPITLVSSPQKICDLKTSKVSRCPLEDYDPNSQDSGYGASYPDREETTILKSRDGFRFAEPLGVAPRKMSVESRSPVQSPLRSSPKTPKRPSSFFRSLSSEYESMDDGFNELIDMDGLVESTQLLPNGISNLLSGHIVASSEKPMECDAATTPEFARTKPTILRRSLSLQNDRMDKSASSPIATPPSISKVRSCLFRSPNATSSTAKLSYNDNNPRESNFYSPSCSPPTKSFKRPEPPTDASPVLVKRSKKSSSLQQISEAIPSIKPGLQRSHSETEAHAHIKSAIHRSTTDNDLTGDFSKTCILPLADGHHEDLKSITPETLRALMQGEFKDKIDSFTIIDCRYPYEYDGGHINGALNLYSKDLIEQILLNPRTQTPSIEPASNKRSILVFHCEFSWERGPNLSRFLRNIDRQRNKEHYPALHYPEVYLLHGGYEEFYRKQKELCSPQGYRPMKHPDHEADLRQFRNKSKSWQGEKSRLNGLTARANLKRLGF